MNPYPSPLLCLYCDKIILPGTFEGCRDHMFECDKHPASGMQKALNEILNKIRSERLELTDPHDVWNFINRIDKIAEDGLR